VVHAGESVDVTPAPAPPPSPNATPPEPSTPAPPSTASPPAPPPVVARRQTERPFPFSLVLVGGGLTVAAGVVSVPLEAHAWTLRNRATDQPTIPSADRSSFENARTWAYVTVGSAIGLATVTAALATWYFLGTSTREVVVTPGGVAGRF
jgi:hypothetical protein